MMKLFVLVLCTQQCFAGHELEMTLSQRALDKFCELSLMMFQHFNKFGRIPTVDGSISNIKINSFQVLTAKLSFIEGRGLKLNMRGLSINLICDWTYDTWLWSFGGTASMETTSSLDFSFLLGVDRAGYPTINPHDCSNVMSKFVLTLGGSYFSFVYNYLVWMYEDIIKTMIGTQVCTYAKDFVHIEANRKLKSFNKESMINKYLVIDYSLVKNPFIGKSYIKYFFKGQFKGDDFNEMTPPLLTHNEKMISFSISENVFNSALRLIFKAGAISYLINGNQISNECELNSHHVKVYATDAPRSGISTKGIVITSSGRIEFIPHDSYNQTTYKVFVSLAAKSRDLSLRTYFLHGSLNIIEFIMTNSSSSDVSDRAMYSCIHEVFDIVLGQANDQLSKGLQLPKLQWVTFNSTSFDFQSKYITVSTDVKWNWE